MFQNFLLNDQAASVNKSDISQEELEDQMKYAGALTTPTGNLKRPLVEFSGQHAWMNRMGKLKHSVNTFQPSEGRYLSFHQTSNVQVNSGIELPASISQPCGKSGSDSVRNRVEVDPSQSTAWKAWYDEPISHTIASARSSLGSWKSFGVPFVTGMKKIVSEHHTSTGSHSNVTDALPASQYSFQNYCVLPSVSALLDKDSTVVHVEFASGLVVAFYDEKGEEKDNKKRRGSQGEFVENQLTVPVTGVTLYNTSSLNYSVRRYVCTMVQSHV